MIHDPRKIVVILGPTASGKTDWGISLAKKYNGEVICADSRTVYQNLDIATAKPIGRSHKEKSLAKLGCWEVEGIRHYLLDFVSPKKIYTVAQFQVDALKAIQLIMRRKKLPLIVGGSALYIYALARGYRFAGKGDRRLRRELELKSLVELQAMIKKNKKISLNSSDFQNKRRLIRAIEINKNYKLKIKIFSLSPIPYSFLKIGIDMPRQKVYERIDRRTKSWMKNDLLINEVKNLIRQKISKKRIIEFGLGYRETLRYLAGEIKTKEELADRINFSQHAYVRRQLTWFRKDKEIKWCKKLAEAEKLVNHFLLK